MEGTENNLWNRGRNRKGIGHQNFREWEEIC